MEFVIKKTTELTVAEKNNIVSIFNSIFDKNRTVESFDLQYENTDLGYSYHSLIINDSEIVGCNSYIPFYYDYFGQRVLVCVSVDSMVCKPFRDFANFYDMVTGAYERMKDDGVCQVLGFPNNMAYKVYVKSKLASDIGKLYTYALPYRIGEVKQKLQMFNFASILFSRIFVCCSLLFSSNKTHKFNIQKNSSTYNDLRYRWFGGNYNIVKKEKFEFVYKIKLHEGVRTVFLVDVEPKTARNFAASVSYIIKKESSKFDLLLYVGDLPFNLNGLIKIPHKYEPKNFNFTTKILDKKVIDKEVFDVKNWDINLSNFDLL